MVLKNWGRSLQTGSLQSRFELSSQRGLAAELLGEFGVLALLVKQRHVLEVQRVAACGLFRLLALGLVVALLHGRHNLLQRVDKSLLVGARLHGVAVLIADGLENGQLALQVAPRVVQRVEGVVILARFHKPKSKISLALHTNNTTHTTHLLLICS